MPTLAGSAGHGRDQKGLTETLVALPTFPERLTYLLDEQSDFFTVNGNIVVDPAAIDTQAEGLTRHSASAAFIAEWVQHHGCVIVETSTGRVAR